MVTEAEVVSRIDGVLRVVTAEVDDLPARAEWWASETDDNRIVFTLEWQELMARLKLVANADQQARLTPDQQARYRAVLQKLKAALPIIRCLELMPPPVSLEA